MPWMLLALVAAVVFTRKGEAPAPEAPEPSGGALPRGTHFERVTPDEAGKVQLETGTSYLAEIAVPALARFLVTEDKLREGLEAEGFVPIMVKHDKPDFWPPGEPVERVEWYVLTAYSGDPRPRDVPAAIGRIFKVVA